MNVPELKSLLARNKAPIAFAASLTPKNIPLTTAEKNRHVQTFPSIYYIVYKFISTFSPVITICCNFSHAFLSPYFYFYNFKLGRITIKTARIKITLAIFKLRSPDLFFMGCLRWLFNRIRSV
jgi:hypothetical protein